MKGIEYAIIDYGKKCVFSRNGAVMAIDSISGDLFKVNLRIVTPKICDLAGNINNELSVESRNESLQLYHERLCHQTYKYVKYFLENK